MSDQDNSNSDQPKPVDPLEAQLKAQEKTQEADPLDVHAQYFYLYFPRFRSHLNMMNKKALIRLISSLVECPLNAKELKLRSRQEQDCFQIADQLLVSKYFMMIMTDLQMQDKLQKESLDKQVPLVVDSKSNEGENNG